MFISETLFGLEKTVLFDLFWYKTCKTPIILFFTKEASN